ECVVGGVGVVIGQCEAKEEGISTEDFLEIIDDRDGAAFTHEDGFALEGRFERAQGGLGAGAGGGDEVGLRAVTGLNLQADGGGTEFLQVLPDQFDNAVGALVGDEADGYFNARPGGDNGLAAFALVPAGQAVDFEGGTGGALL